MANLGDLKARIISETVRDDLADDLKAQFDVMIRGAIEEWATQHFWFNEGRVVAPLVVGTDMQVIPPNMRIIDSLWVQLGGSRFQLRKMSMEEIEDLSISPSQGQPSDWCEFGGGFRIWPVPNVAYPIIFIGVIDVAPVLDFTKDTSANAWTNEGQDLITATTKKRLYRDYLSAVAQDPRFGNAVTQEGEALSALTARSNRKIATGRIRPGW